MTNIAFTGRRALGGVKMRGVAVADKLGVPFVDLSELSGRYDTLVLVKYWTHGKDSDYAKISRRSCTRLVFDPLDVFSGTKPDAEPSLFWSWCWNRLHFDDLIATSPACAETMETARASHGDVPAPFVIHQAPHHADPRVGPDWYNPNGPVVYAGGVRFIASALPRIQAACDRLGRRLLLDYRRDCWERLKGAALALHLRLPPEDTPLNRHAKPQVKLENAAAAGVPCLATPDPCVTSLREVRGGLTAHREHNPDWQSLIDDSLDGDTLSNPVTLDHHCARMARILGL